VNAACSSFRSLLEQKLAGRPDPSSLRSLAWHEHLLGCGACRTLLEDEEALEGLLATLPDPRLPPEIRRRVLVALARSRNEEDALDRLLDLDHDTLAPTGLARGVLDGLAARRAEIAAGRDEDPLEHLLVAGDTVDVPSGLAGSVLASLEHARRAGAERIDAAGELVGAQGEFAGAQGEFAGAQGKLVGAQGERELDRLLDRAGAVAVPGALSTRVLDALRHQRTLPRAIPVAPTRRTTRVRTVWVYAAAAGLVATLAVWAVWPRQPAPTPDVAVEDATSRPVEDGTSTNRANGVDGRTASVDDPSRRVPATNGTSTTTPPRDVAGAGAPGDVEVARAPDAQMLAAMDVLENWDYLMQNDVDVLLSTIEPADEALLDYQEGG